MAEGVDDVAWKKNIIGMHGARLRSNGLELGRTDFSAKMNVADHEEFKILTQVWLIKTVASMIETFHI